jgi:hypothetical protein
MQLRVTNSTSAELVCWILANNMATGDTESVERALSSTYSV